MLNRGQKDLAAGAAWSGKAAEQGHPQAQYYLGILYAFGQDLPQSAQQARHWLLEAKANGFTKAGNVITFLEGGYAQPVKVQNPRTGDQMEITVKWRSSDCERATKPYYRTQGNPATSAHCHGRRPRRSVAQVRWLPLNKQDAFLYDKNFRLSLCLTDSCRVSATAHRPHEANGFVI